jgi:hypothetical protein
MKTTLINTLALCALSTLAAGCSKSPKLDEKWIHQLISKSVAAANKMDADGVCSALADTAEFRLEVSGSSGSDIKKMNKSEYCEYLRQGYQEVKATGTAAFTNSINIKSIDIAPGGKGAIVDAELVESFSTRGQTVSQRSKQVTTIQLINGQPLYTVISASTSAGR